MIQIAVGDEKSPQCRGLLKLKRVIHAMPNLNYGVENIDISDVNSDVNLRNQIKDAINENSKVTQRELVGKLGVSFRQVQQNMAELVKLGEITRIGSTRNGHSEILNIIPTIHQMLFRYY